MINSVLVTDVESKLSDPRSGGSIVVPGLVTAVESSPASATMSRSWAAGDQVDLRNSLVPLACTEEWRQYNALISRVDPTHAQSWAWHWYGLESLKGIGVYTSGSPSWGTGGAGYLTLTTSAAANDVVLLGFGPDAAYGLDQQVGGVATNGTSAYYGMAARFRVPAAVSGSVAVHFGLESISNAFGYAVIGSLPNTSTTYWSVEGNEAAGTATTVAIDTAWHTFMIYRVGATTYAEIDGTVVYSGGSLRNPYASGIEMSVGNGASGGVKSGDFAWACLLTPAV